MSRYGQPDFKFSISTASGSTTLHDISQYIIEFNGVNIEAITQQSDAFGDSWVEHAYTGVRRVEDMQIMGFYDDAASTGPHALFGNASHLGAERQWEADFGSSDVVNGKAIIGNYSRRPIRNQLTEYRVTLRTSSAVGTAT